MSKQSDAIDALSMIETDPVELDYSDGFRAGYLAAALVLQKRFFGGPTKDMVLGWLEAEWPGEGPMQARSNAVPEEKK